ncbi:MAG TPA: urate hydroxylase PuuD [Alphaproteobacteria bacterium]
MAAFFSSLQKTVIAGFVLAFIVFLYYATVVGFNGGAFWPFLFRWLHIISGVMWIGLLYYFNFVQTPGMPKIPAEQKPAITKVIAPSALFWFRWGAMSTIATGWILAILNGYFWQAYTLDLFSSNGWSTRVIGVGMWLGTIMWFNVWFIIWPNQQKILGLVSADDATKAQAAKAAGMASRINTMLSIPMLFCMAAASHLA